MYSYGQTEGLGWIDSVRCPDQEYICTMGSVTPPSICYIHHKADVLCFLISLYMSQFSGKIYYIAD